MAESKVAKDMVSMEIKLASKKERKKGEVMNTRTIEE